MDYPKIFELYEKLYFHEVEAREKISARLQIPLAIMLSYVSIYAVFLKGLDLSDLSKWHALFLLVVFISLCLFITNCTFFVKAFYGHTYEFLPSAQVTEEYRKKLIETYQDYENCDELVSKYFSEYLFKYYNECSSINTNVNDRRSDALHKSNTFSILNVFPLVLAFILFVYSGVDKNSKDKEYKVSITSPLKIESNFNEQPTKASTATATSASPKEDTERGRKNSEQAKPAKAINEDKHVKRRSETSSTTSTTAPTNKTSER